ncbi:963_t:CDS:2 [Ambispora gerdemannii]|uniref:963_t:CDS:1 n=1 Tax=Ambispora gerdemannii TaxID=144530 RepID=A0A9N8Z3T4_9GLOM|nr:963_t:CDS:2 [Ambispora gerdemannii]
MLPTVLLLKDKEVSYEKPFALHNYETKFLPILQFNLTNAEELSTLLKNGPDASIIWGIVVTSQRAVKALAEAWKAAENDISPNIQTKWKSLPFFVVGNTTANIATRDLGFTPIGAKESGNAELLADFIELQNICENEEPNTNQDQEKQIPFNWVVFFSPSGVDLALPTLKNLKFWKWIKVAAIGPTTKEHLIMNRSVDVSVVSPKPDPQSLAKVIFKYDSSFLKSDSFSSV